MLLNGTHFTSYTLLCAQQIIQIFEVSVKRLVLRSVLFKVQHEYHFGIGCFYQYEKMSSQMSSAIEMLSLDGSNIQ